MAEDPPTEREAWEDLYRELDELCRLHQDGIADFTRCRDFGHRLSLLLDRVESLGFIQLADRVMDLMAGCSPKVASHCENALSTRARLETLRDRALEKLKELESSRE